MLEKVSNETHFVIQAVGSLLSLGDSTCTKNRNKILDLKLSATVICFLMNLITLYNNF